MGNWFDTLVMALYGNVYIALGAALLWGILSILISPCHLASIPIVVAFINEQKESSTKKAFLISLNFSLGILITLAIVAAITSVAGIILGSADLIMRLIVAVLLILVGLYFLDLLPLPDFGAASDKRVKNRPYLSGFLLGLVFGIALGPCALAFMAPILGIVLSSISTQFWFCIGLVGMFILGHCGVLILAGTFTNLVKKFLKWNVASQGTRILRKVCGILILAGAVYTILQAFNIKI